jgi:homoserine dehydrogenase
MEFPVQNKNHSDPLVVGLAGFGTVGKGFARILEENQTEIFRRAGREIRIKKVLVRDVSRGRTQALPPGASFCAGMDELAHDPDIDVLVELIGGIEQAERLIRQALDAGKHVVTANKALLAEQGEPLFALAARKKLFLGYEASVCGGVPVVQTLRASLAANRLTSILGILNGTCNYILSAMTTRNMPFAEALKEAQDLGYAEADPGLDIDGVDSAHKLTLLIRLAWGVNYPFRKLPVSGIRGITPEDIMFAREFGYNIKLLGHAYMDSNRIEAGVFPTLVPSTYLLARVGHSYNAVRMEGNAVGPLFMHGLGAGDLPTGSAVAADLLEIARGGKTNNQGYIGNALPSADILPPETASSRYYFRLTVEDKPGVMRDVASIFADNNISIHQVLQKGQSRVVPLVFMTHKAKALNIQNAAGAIAGCAFVSAAPVYYRVLPPPGGAD